MKMSKETFEIVVLMVRRCRQIAPSLRDSYREAGLSEERFRWDMLWSCRGLLGGRVGDLPAVFRSEGLTDNHIDTGLRRAVAQEWPEGKKG